MSLGTKVGARLGNRHVGRLSAATGSVTLPVHVPYTSDIRCVPPRSKLASFNSENLSDLHPTREGGSTRRLMTTAGMKGRHVRPCVRGLIPAAETWQTGGLNINKPHMPPPPAPSLDGRQQQLPPPRQTRRWPDMLQGVYILMPLLVFQNMLPSHPGRAPPRSTTPGDVYHSGRGGGARIQQRWRRVMERAEGAVGDIEG